MIGILPIGRSPHSAFAGNHVALFWSLKRSEYETQRADGLEILKGRVARAWPESSPILDEIGSFEEVSLATYCDARMRRFHAGRVLAMGDAAHATSPQLGQGANLALIDAYTLAFALRVSSSIDQALALYERRRRAHIRFYQMASRALTPLFQSGSKFAPAARDLLFGPLGRLPFARHIMRTTLAGVRQFPWGTWKLQD
jgi:2-polyprenyl-6-methoxyphenol hydroxylase-like FAD-dependent oxidoreductase